MIDSGKTAKNVKIFWGWKFDEEEHILSLKVPP